MDCMDVGSYYFSGGWVPVEVLWVRWFYWILLYISRGLWGVAKGETRGFDCLGMGRERGRATQTQSRNPQWMSQWSKMELSYDLCHWETAAVSGFAIQVACQRTWVESGKKRPRRVMCAAAPFHKWVETLSVCYLYGDTVSAENRYTFDTVIDCQSTDYAAIPNWQSGGISDICRYNLYRYVWILLDLDSTHI